MNSDKLTTVFGSVVGIPEIIKGAMLLAVDPFTGAFWIVQGIGLLGLGFFSNKG